MRRSLLWLALLGGAMPALAADQADAEREDKPTITESVLVTAALTEESADLLPVSAQVIERDEIEARQATSIADLLRTVPGLDIVRSGTAGKVTSLFTRGTESDQTLVLWNGLELNDPFFGGFDWGLLPTDGVERVEVIRGPFSALYGSDAVGGVVQVLTGAVANSLSIEAGENGYGRAALVGRVERERFGFDFAAHSRRGDGEVENDFYDSDDAMASARWAVGSGVEVGLTVRANESELGIPFAGGQRSPNRRTSWTESEAAIPFAVERGDWKIAGQLSKVSLESTFEDPDDAFGFTASEDRSTSERARVVVTRRLGEELWIAAGSEYERQEVDSASTFGVGLDGERQTTQAIFSQLFFTAGRWRLDLGLRADDHDAFGSAVTPRLGLGVAVSGRHRLHLAVAEGFRAPSIGELFFPLTGNPTLEPERSESLELGWVFSGTKVDGTVVAFYTELEDLIDFDLLEFFTVNIGRARTEGVEVGLTVHGSTTELRANATYLHTENLDTGLALLRRPSWRGSVVVSWRPRDWVLSGTVLYTGKRADIDPIAFIRRDNASYERLDVAARYRGWPRWAPYARVENLTDEAYSEALGFPAPGIKLIGGVSLGF